MGGLENVSCLLRLLHIFKCFPDEFYHGSKNYEPRSDCSEGSSLIWVHIVMLMQVYEQKREKVKFE